MRNQGIRDRIKQAGLKQWQVAEALGVHEYTFLRWLRYPLTDERRQAILEAIAKAEEVIRNED